MMYVVGFGGWTGYMQRENLVCSVVSPGERANKRTSDRANERTRRLVLDAVKIKRATERYNEKKGGGTLLSEVIE